MTQYPVRFITIALAAAMLVAAWLTAGPAAAQTGDWPTRTVKLVVPQAAGGGTDFLGRLFAERLQSVFGQPFIVDNRVGAGGNIGTEHVAKQPPDGYTFLVTTSTHVTNLSFFKKLPYEPIKDFEAVSLCATIPFVMAVNSASPIKSVKELIDLARAKPGTVTYASSGIGTPQHLVTELFKSMTGIDMTHVPYKGSAPAATALVANDVNTSVTAVSSLLPYVRAGKLRPLAVTTGSRTPLMPEVPTLAELTSMPELYIDIWYGVLAPAGTPRPILERLSTEINRIVRDPQIAKERLAPIGIEGLGSTPEHLMEVMKGDVAKYRKIAKDANITPE